MISWAVVADVELCQAHQVCRLDAPEIFGFDRAADAVVVRQTHPPDALRPRADLAVTNCPAMALSIVETPVED